MSLRMALLHAGKDKVLEQQGKHFHEQYKGRNNKKMGDDIWYLLRLSSMKH